MNKFQKLAFLHAMTQRFKELEAAARRECDAELLEGYDPKNGGTNRVNIAFDGQPVGSLSITTTGGDFGIFDEPAFMEWAIPAGAAREEWTVNASALTQPLKDATLATLKEHGAAVCVNFQPVADWRDWLTFAPGGRIVDLEGQLVEGVGIMPRGVSGTRISKCGYKDVAPVITAQQAREALAEALGIALPALEGGDHE